MTILDEFERKTIEVRGENDRIEHAAVWCYGELYIAHVTLDRKPMWQIGCIPLGLCFPHEHLGFYRTIEDACLAVKELVRINNCWAMIDGFDRETERQLQMIAAKCNGFRVITRDFAEGKADAKTIVPNLNGASVENYQ